MQCFELFSESAYLFWLLSLSARLIITRLYVIIFILNKQKDHYLKIYIVFKLKINKQISFMLKKKKRNAMLDILYANYKFL